MIKAMKILYHMNQRQRLKTMSTPLRNPVPMMKSIAMKKMTPYVIIEAVLWSVKEAGLHKAFA